MPRSVTYAKRLDAALEYAGIGYPVLPIKPREKRPLTAHGLHDATTNEAVLREWWGRWPNANLAIRCDRLAVIDIDPGASWPPEDLRQEIKAAKPALQRTPRGGWHILFRLPEGKAWGPTAGKIAEHVDTRCGQGCYLMVAPSTTERGRYRWIRPLRPAEELPLPPEALVKIFDSLAVQSTVREATATTTPTASCVGIGEFTLSDIIDQVIIPEGCRNTRLTSLGGKLRRMGFDSGTIENILQTTNHLRCRPPLPEGEVSRIAQSVSRYPAGPALAWTMSRAWRKSIAHRRTRYVK